MIKINLLPQWMKDHREYLEWKRTSRRFWIVAALLWLAVVILNVW